MDDSLIVLALLAVTAVLLLPRLRARLLLSRAKHPSLAGHARIAKAVASRLPFYEYDAEWLFRVDDAPHEVAARRQAGFERLSSLLRERFPPTLELTCEIEDGISDLQFTATHRVPFQFSRFVRRHLGTGAFAAASSWVMLEGLDGNRLYDLTGSYGVNVFGYDFYKECVARGIERVKELGPVLGPYHPLIAYNV